MVTMNEESDFEKWKKVAARLFDPQARPNTEARLTEELILGGYTLPIGTKMTFFNPAPQTPHRGGQGVVLAYCRVDGDQLTIRSNGKVRRTRLTGGRAAGLRARR